MDYKLAPSDLTYLYEDCKRCFVLKAKHGIVRPSIGLPSIFNKIDTLQNQFYSGRRTEEFCKELPPGVVQYGEKWLQSEAINLAGCSSGCYIRGRFDIAVKFDEGGYGVIDFKTRAPAEEPTEMYGRQLRAYAHALENPEPGNFGLSPITRVGLLYFGPSTVELKGERQYLSGPLEWAGVPRDEEGFKDFLRGVVELLDGELPQPQSCDRCDHCKGDSRCRAGSGTPQQKLPCICCPWCVYRLETAKMGV